MRQRRHRKLPHLLNTRYRKEKGASHARLAVVEERREDFEIEKGLRPLSVEEARILRRHEEELSLAKLRQLRADYEVHLKGAGR